MRRRAKAPEKPAPKNAALELFRSSTGKGRYAFTYVDSIGVIEPHRFVEVSQDAALWAHLLRREGLEHGARVIVLTGRDRHWRSAFLGVVEAGGVAVPCPGSTAVAEIRSLAEKTHAVGVVSAVARPDLAATGIPVLCADDLEARQTAYAHAEVAYPTDPHDFAVILNGHNGFGSRGAAYTHDALLEQASFSGGRLEVGERERVWCTIPEGSAASLWLALAAWHLGVELVVVEEDLAPPTKLELLSKLKPAAVWFSDDEYAELASANPPSWVDLSQIRRAMTSGEPAQGALAFQETFGVTAAPAPVLSEIGVDATAPAHARPPAVSARLPGDARTGMQDGGAQDGRGRLAPLRPVRSEDVISREPGKLAAAKARVLAEQTAARAEEAKRREQERLFKEAQARRRDEQLAKERRNEEKRRLAEAKRRKLAERAALDAAKADERRRAEEVKRNEQERVRKEAEARRREEQLAKERRQEEKRRLEAEAKQRKLAEKAARDAAKAEEQRRAEEAKRNEQERLRRETAARRREEQLAKERQDDERHRQQEARQRALAEAALAEQIRRAEEAKQCEHAERAAAEERKTSETAAREAALALERRRAEEEKRREEESRREEAKRRDQNQRAAAEERRRAEETARAEERRRAEEAKQRQRVERAAEERQTAEMAELEHERNREEKQREEQRRRDEEEARRQEETQGKQRQKDDEHRRREEAKNLQRAARAASGEHRRLAKAERLRKDAALAEQRRRAEVEARRERARRIAAERARAEALAPDVISRIDHYSAGRDVPDGGRHNPRDDRP